MANFERVEITFGTGSGLGDLLSFGSNDPDIVITETAVSLRTSPFEFTNGVTPETAAQRYYSALVADYGVYFTISLNSATVTIEAKSYDTVFFGFSFPGYITYNYIPSVGPVDLEINSITPTTADGGSECINARFDFNINNVTYPVTILSPVSKVANNAGELFFDYQRFPIPAVNLQIQDATTSQDSALLPRISSYTFVDDDISVVESFSGATVSLSPQIDNVGDVGITFTYSLDDITYQAGNTYYGLLAGSYTGYILDNFGCKKTANFTVTGILVDKPGPIFTIQNANGLKHFKSETFDYKTTFPNFDNADINNQEIFNTEKRCYKQPVQTNDTSITQIQTNYETLTVNVRRISDDEIVASPTATEVTTNINKKDKRDCKIISGGEGKTNIYFPGGNIYTPDTATIEGSYTNANLLLPDFLDSETIKSGVGATLSDNAVLNGDFNVESSVYNTDINGRALQINAAYTGDVDGTDAIVQSLYNALDYNVWEYSINWGSLPEGDYYIETIGTDTDPRYNDVTWYSEPINSAVRQEGTTYIEWANSNNYAQMDYSTGIVNFMRVPARFALYNGVGEKETFETDSGKVILLKEIIADDITLETDLIPQYVGKKLMIAAGHSDNLTINGLNCAQQEKGELESLFPEQNRMYKYNGSFRLDSSIILTDETGIVSDAGDVLGTGSGNFVLGINL